MLNILFKIGLSVAFIKFINDCYNNRHNLNNYFINILYNIIHLYSKLTILFNKHINCNIKKRLFNVYNKFFNSYLTIEFCEKGILFRTNYIFKSNISSKEKILELKKNIEPLEYDLIIYSEKDDEQDKINKICYKQFPDSFSYEKSNIKFLSLILFYNDISIEIELANEVNNFYIVNNVINKNFFIYYLSNIKKVKDFYIGYLFEFNYKLELIDHNVNIINLDETDEIIIEQKNYIIKKQKNIEDNGFIIT
jgi:hypothetical protein